MLDSKETVSSVLQKCRSSSGAVEKGLEESPARSSRVGWPSTACLFVLAIDFMVIFHILDKHLLASSLVSEILNTRDNRKVWPNKGKSAHSHKLFGFGKKKFQMGFQYQGTVPEAGACTFIYLSKVVLGQLMNEPSAAVSSHSLTRRYSVKYFARI